MSQISDDARAIKAYIEQHGWVQNAYGLGNQVCIVGAYNQITSGYHSAYSEGDLQDNDISTICAIRDYVGVQFIGSEYNDEPGRTKQEVLDMLENVAIKYDDDAMRSLGNE